MTDPYSIYYNTYWNARSEGYSDSAARRLADAAYRFAGRLL
jgi:hypothetical protein